MPRAGRALATAQFSSSAPSASAAAVGREQNLGEAAAEQSRRGRRGSAGESTCRQAEYDPRDPRGGKQVPALAGCSLTCTCTRGTHTHTE